MEIKIFDNIDDPKLKKAWNRLQIKNNLFSQMSYDWLEPWIRIRFRNRKLYIVSVIIDDEIIAIVPLCIENFYGLKLLRTLPIHFGDFYYIVGNIDKSILKFIIDFLKNNTSYDVINLQNINSGSLFYKKLIEYNSFHNHKISDIVYTKCENNSIDDLISSLSKNQRKSLKRRIRRINESGVLNFKVISNRKDYEFYEKDMKRIFYKKWKEKRTKENEQVFEYRKRSFGNSLINNKAEGFMLLLDDKLIAYCLGFYFLNEYRSWKLVYDDEYSSFGPGIILTAQILVYLSNKKIEYYNHGNGFYPYKLIGFAVRFYQPTINFFSINL